MQPTEQKLKLADLHANLPNERYANPSELSSAHHGCSCPPFSPPMRLLLPG
jgi:hypothetical protein